MQVFKNGYSMMSAYLIDDDDDDGDEHNDEQDAAQDAQQRLHAFTWRVLYHSWGCSGQRVYVCVKCHANLNFIAHSLILLSTHCILSSSVLTFGYFGKDI